MKAQLLTVSLALAAALAGNQPTLGQTAFYSLEGNLGAAGGQHDFLINLSRDVSSSEVLRFETFANNGGTNAAGSPVFSLGIDSVLQLLDSSNASRGINDNFNPSNPSDGDSLLSWPGVVPPGLINSTPLNPDPLPSGDYRLNLAEVGSNPSGRWAVDLVGASNALSFTGASPTGTSVVGSFKYGTSGSGVDPAAFNQAGGSFTAVGDLFPAWLGQGTLSVTAGGQLSSASLFLASDAGATGVVTVSGTDGAKTPSHLSTSNLLTIGDRGDGTLNIASGGRATSLTGTVGNFPGSVGRATVTGVGSLWTNTGELFIGNAAQGTLAIEDAGQVNSATTTIGNFAGGNGRVSIDGAASAWVNSGNLTIGEAGVGELSITGGTATVDGTTTINSTGTLNLGVTGAGTFHANGDVIIDAGTINGGAQGVFRLGAGRTFTALNNAQITLPNETFADESTLNIESGSNLVVDFFDDSTNSDDRDLTGTLNIRSGAQVTIAMRQQIGGGDVDGAVLVSGVDANGNPSRFVAPGGLTLGSTRNETGSLRVEGGAIATSRFADLGGSSGSAGLVTVTGTDGASNPSTWAVDGNVLIGGRGPGAMTISAGGLVTNQDSTFAGDNTQGIDSIVRVTGTSPFGFPSTWTTRGALNLVDNNSFGPSMEVSAGGKVTSASGNIGFVPDGNANGVTGAVMTVTGAVVGSRSTWEVTGNLDIGTSIDRDGVAGDGTLNITNGALVTVGGATDIGPGGIVNLDGGRFEFGRMSLEDYTAMNAVSGSLAGAVDGVALTGSNEVSTISAVPPAGIFPPAVDVSEVVIGVVTNQGYLFGAGSLEPGLFNDTTGEIEVITGERMRLNGPATVNAGQVTLAGGQVQFTQGFTNQASGLVIGDGGLRAEGGVTNDGVMAFTATTRVIGDVTNNGVISSSGGTTTFFDDLQNNGEVRTNADSFTVYFGEYSGNGDTGTGTVILEGDLKPGFSPGVTAFGGDLQFGDNASLLVELAGLLPGVEHDVVTVFDSLILNGRLDLALLDGFTPGLNQVFEIIDVGGDLTGAFDGLAEGGLVGNFGGADVFITYAGGDGNDVALFAAVPEPTALALLGIGGLIAARRRRLGVTPQIN